MYNMTKIIIALTAINVGISIYNTLILKTIMGKQDLINASLAELNTATDEIAADLQALRDQVASGDPVSDESLAALDSAVKRLTAMGQDPANPIPPEEPPVEPTV